MHLRLESLVNGFVTRVVPKSAAYQKAPQPVDRIAFAPRIDFIGASIAGVVVGRRVCAPPVAHAFDEGRTAAFARPLDRVTHGGVHGQCVGTVDSDAVETIGHGLDRDRLGCGLKAERHRDGVLVVTANEHDWKFVDARDVQSGVKAFFRRRAVAEEVEDHLGPFTDARRPSEADGVCDSVSDRTRDRRDVPRAGPVVRRKLTPFAEVVRRSEQLGEILFHRDAALKERSRDPVVGKQPIVVLERACRGYGERFLAFRGAIDTDAALPV